MGYRYDSVLAIATKDDDTMAKVLATVRLMHPQEAEWFMQGPQCAKVSGTTIVWFHNYSKMTPDTLFSALEDMFTADEATVSGSVRMVTLGEEGESEDMGPTYNDDDLGQHLWDFQVVREIAMLPGEPWVQPTGETT